MKQIQNIISYYIIWDLNLNSFICNFIISIIFRFKSNILLDLRFITRNLKLRISEEGMRINGLLKISFLKNLIRSMKKLTTFVKTSFHENNNYGFTG